MKAAYEKKVGSREGVKKAKGCFREVLTDNKK
jgi:hypothetical protein